MNVAYKLRPFSVDEYYTMAQAGILSEDDRVELIDGRIITMSPIGSRHAACVNRLNRFLSQKAGDRAVVSAQNPIRLNNFSEPEPDLALLKPRDDFYASGHPGPEDVLLVIEVAETSAASDRRIKVPLYARSGIPEVWLVDLEQDVIEVYRQPSPEGYRELHTLERGQSVNVLAFPETALSVKDALG